MAKKKSIEMQKFGGTESIGKAKPEKHEYDLSSVEVNSDTKIESDEGHGAPAIIRRFTFGMNVANIKEVKPTKQDLFNSHLKGIELALWKDGLKPFDKVQPRISIDEKGMKYHIFVTAIPQRGHLLRQKPQTLSEIIHE